MHRSLLPLLLSLSAVPGLAQTASHTPSTVHRTGASTAHRATAKPAAPACATLPEISPKVPALPASAGCAKALVTVSEGIVFSPLVGPELRKNFADLPVTFSLAYVDTVPGTGEQAQPHMYYTVKYTGYLADGTKFDSSYDHEETKNGLPFPYGGHRVIPGWDMGFEGMHIGGKRRLYIPYQLAYGDRGRPPVIPPKAELVFDMELISQSATDPTPKPPAPPPPPSTGAPASPSAPPAGSPAATTPDTKPVPPPASAQPSTTPSTPPADVKPAPPQ